MESTEQVVRRLVGASTVAVLRIRTGTGDLSIESRFMKEGAHHGNRGIWVRLAGGDTGLVERLIASAAPILAAADDGPRRVTFVTSLVGRHKGLFGGGQVLLAWPGEVKSQERRRAERERIPAGADVAASLIGAESSAFTRGVQPAQVWDVSIDGACLMCPATVAGKLKGGDVLHIQLRFAGAEHRVAARVCRTQALAGGVARVGIQFVEGAALSGPLGEFLEDLRSQRVRRSLNRAMVKGA